MLDGITLNNKQSDSVLDSVKHSDKQQPMMTGSIDGTKRGPIRNSKEGKMGLPSNMVKRKTSDPVRVKSEQPLPGEDFIFNQSQMSSGRVMQQIQDRQVPNRMSQV